MLRSLGDITDGFATDQLTHCLPDGHPRRARRRRRRGGGRQPVPRHRQGHQRARPPADRRRDPQALRAARGAQDDPRAPGLPGRALLPPLRRRPERPREAPRRRSPPRSGSSPSSSPTSGTRRPSTPTTTRSPSSTSRTGSATVFAQRQALLDGSVSSTGGHAVVVVGARSPRATASSTTGWALAMATPRPAHWSMARSLWLSPNASTSAGADAEPRAHAAGRRRPCRRPVAGDLDERRARGRRRGSRRA